GRAGRKCNDGNTGRSAACCTCDYECCARNGKCSSGNDECSVRRGERATCRGECSTRNGECDARSPQRSACRIGRPGGRRSDTAESACWRGGNQRGHRTAG